MSHSRAVSNNEGFVSLRHHEDYYLSSGDLFFLVKQYHFRVHRYFFERESKYFKPKLAVPASPGSPRQGTSESTAIVLDDVSPDDFASFLWVFYNPKYSLYKANLANWTSIIDLAHRWGFPEVKALAVREMEKIEIPDVERIYLYHKNDVDRQLLLSRYAALAERQQPLTLEEGMRLGMETTLNIVRARECMRSPLQNGLRSPSPANIDRTEMHSIITDLFGLAAEPVEEAAPEASLPPFSSPPLSPTPASKTFSSAPAPPTPAASQDKGALDTSGGSEIPMAAPMATIPMESLGLRMERLMQQTFSGQQPPPATSQEEPPGSPTPRRKSSPVTTHDPTPRPLTPARAVKAGEADRVNVHDGLGSDENGEDDGDMSVDSEDSERTRIGLSHTPHVDGSNDLTKHLDPEEDESGSSDPSEGGSSAKGDVETPLGEDQKVGEELVGPKGTTVSGQGNESGDTSGTIVDTGAGSDTVEDSLGDDGVGGEPTGDETEQIDQTVTSATSTDRIPGTPPLLDLSDSTDTEVAAQVQGEQSNLLNTQGDEVEHTATPTTLLTPAKDDVVLQDQGDTPTSQGGETAAGSTSLTTPDAAQTLQEETKVDPTTSADPADGDTAEQAPPAIVPPVPTDTTSEDTPAGQAHATVVATDACTVADVHDQTPADAIPPQDGTTKVAEESLLTPVGPVTPVASAGDEPLHVHDETTNADAVAQPAGQGEKTHEEDIDEGKTLADPDETSAEDSATATAAPNDAVQTSTQGDAAPNPPVDTSGEPASQGTATPEDPLGEAQITVQEPPVENSVDTGSQVGAATKAPNDPTSEGKEGVSVSDANGEPQSSSDVIDSTSAAVGVKDAPPLIDVDVNASDDDDENDEFYDSPEVPTGWMTGLMS